MHPNARNFAFGAILLVAPGQWRIATLSRADHQAIAYALNILAMIHGHTKPRRPATEQKRQIQAAGEPAL